ncbi:MAG: P27 family phage terminase small subunit [Lachnospirales bacterium]
MKQKGYFPPAPEWLTKSQKDIYNNIIGCLEDSQMLAMNDVWILSQGAITIDRLQSLEKKANTEAGLVFDKDFISAKNSYVRDFFRFCNEMCLSPQARAKLANVATAKKEKEPLEALVAELNERTGG